MVTYSKFPTENIMGAQIKILPLKFSKWGGCHPQIWHFLDENLQTKKNFPTILEGETAPPSLPQQQCIYYRVRQKKVAP